MRPAAPFRKNQPWSRPLAELVSAAIDPVLAKQGFGESSIILNWVDIVGPRIARACEPMRLQWPPRGPKSTPDAPLQPAILILRVEGAFAVELQHQAPLVVERINAHLGWRCVGRLALRQGPLERRVKVMRRVPAFDAQALAAAKAATSGIQDSSLSAALEKLGERALSKQL